MKQRFLSIVVGGVLSIIGLLFVWEGIPHTSSVTCERIAKQPVDCLKQEKIFWWIAIKTTLLKNLQVVHRVEAMNAYDSKVYAIYWRGENNELIFGNTLDMERIQADLLQAQQFLKNGKPSSLTLERYKVNWVFALVGSLVGGLGVWIVIYRYS
jgi:hypothetical protein